MRRFLGFFRGNYFFRVLVFAFCFAATVAWGPATAAEISPETRDLFLAVSAGDIGAVKKTLLAGADVNGENASGLTPVDVAIDGNNFKIAHYLFAWRKHRQSASLPARRPRIAPPPRQPAFEQPAPAQPVPEIPRSYVVKTEPPTPLPPAPPTTLPPAPSTPENPIAAEPVPPPQPAPPERAVVIIEPPEPAPENTIAAALSKVETPPEAAPETSPEPAQGMLARFADLFSFSSGDDGASAGKASDIRNVPPPETVPETTPEIAAAPEPDSPASSEPVAPAEQIAKTGPDMLDRLADFFSFGSEDEKTTPGTAPEPEQAAAPRPEAEPTPPARAAPPSPIETVTAEAPAPEAETGPDMLDRLANFFSFESKVDDSTTRPTSKPAPVAEPAPPPSPAPAPTPTPETPGAETETAQASPVAAVARAMKAEPERRVRLVLGRSLRLGKVLAPGTSDVCIEKSTPGFWFCIEPVDWPDEIAAAFQVRTTIYRGRQAIVRYEKGAASQFHTLFPTGNFEAIVGYFTASLGAPGKQSDNWAILPAEPNRPNRTVRWRGAWNSVLEIREIDDLRWSSIPDTRHGVVRMYADDPDPVFRHISWSDFMLARIPNKRR